MSMPYHVHVNGGTQSGLDLYDGCGKILCGKDIFDDVETHDTAVHASEGLHGFMYPIIWKVKVKRTSLLFFVGVTYINKKSSMINT